MSFLDVSDLCISYGVTHAVGPLSFTAEAGEFISLLGPSGCGKTTTLRCIAGFAEPSSGDIRVDGRSVVRVPPYRRDMGLVFQSYALFPHLTVFNNVAFGLQLRKRPTEEIRRRVQEALEMVGLIGFDDRFPAQLSGGQQQRVALARSLVLKPKLLLLDEPLSNLDAKLRIQMRALLQQLQRQLGVTTLYVTHDQAEALALSDRIVVMKDGLICQIDGPRQLYRRPATPFVAEFIGASNLVSGLAVTRAVEGGTDVTAEGLELHSSEALPNPRMPSTVTILIRPELIRLLPLTHSLNGDADRTNHLAATVTTVTYLGDSLQVGLLTDTGQDFVANLGPKAPYQPVIGAKVAALIDPDDVHIIRQAVPA